MTEPFVNERLLGKLEVRAGRRQFILTGEILDYFFVDAICGLQLLGDALRIHAAREKFDVVVFVDELVRLTFLHPEMQQTFDQTVRGVSQDPQAGQRRARSFTPRSRRGDNAEPAASDARTSPAGANSSGANVPAANASNNNDASNNAAARAAQDAQEAASATTSSEQTTLDQVTRLLNSPHKCLVVFQHPERMWSGDPTTTDLRKLETVISWCSAREGHPHSLSALVVNPHRMAEFNMLADRWGDRSDFTRIVEIGNAGRRELEAFVRRVLCRYGLIGDAKRLANTAHSRQLSLYNFSEQVGDFLRDHADATTLDGLFSDGEQAKTLDELQAELEALIGLGEVKAMVQKLIRVSQDESQRRRLGQQVSSRALHMFFLGNPGTGKTIVARLLGQLFWAVGLRSTQAFVEIASQDVISAYNEGDTIQNMKDAVARAMGGVLFVDEVYLFAENAWGRKALEALMKDMEDHRDELTVIMAGYEEKLPELFKVNPGFKSRVNYTLHFPDYQTDELVAIVNMQAVKADLSLTTEAQQKLRKYIDAFQRMGGIGNGRGVRNLFERATAALADSQSGANVIQADMIPDPICFREGEARTVLDELNRDFIGLRRVKDFLQRMFVRQRSLDAKGGSQQGFNHCFFLGNPGTGKTSVARRMGRLFYYMGLISEPDKLIEVDPINDLTSKYQAEYAEKVRDCFDRAWGGVLFIDEAYQLAEDSQGTQVIDQIVKLITEPRYRNLIVILAGYHDEMQPLFQANAGLKRRIPHVVEFDDFNTDELTTIFHQCVTHDGHHVAEDERARFDARLRGELDRLSRQRHFGNAGAVQNFYSEVKVNQEMRLLEDSTVDRFELRAADLTPDADTTEDIDAILDEMDRQFIGMRPVKEAIRALARKIKFDLIRESRRRPDMPASTGRMRLYNMRFVGNPGTGKTTIARYMARVFCALGITSQPKVREMRGVDLKGSYVGQTKDRVNEMFENSAGQVVIIDEVYSLQSGRSADTDSFGQEAIDTLVGAITDPRNEGIVLILAGYAEPMNDFLATNPGLASRFPGEVVFPDYSAAECSEILALHLDRDGYLWPRDDDAFEQAVLDLFTVLKRDPHFGNARTVGNVFEQLRDRLDLRLSNMEDPSDEDYFRITLDDVLGLTDGM